MTTHTFETKTEYLNFRAAFAAACNDDRRKSTLKDGYGGSKYRAKGFLQAEHFLLLNILRGRPIHAGFSPITSHNKLDNGAYINGGLYNAVWRLRRIITDVAKLGEDHYSAERAQKNVEEFLEPFNGTVSVALLGNIVVPDVKPIEANFGKGKQIAADIKKGKKITYADMWDLYEVAS